ncbi:amino acid permease [Propionimicrobium sp. BV2F7]|nr:amino acid permease [Propionimicrobium sp. BV2F7]
MQKESPSALKRGLKNRHIQMIALGGAIGTGLFYGSADSIQLAGPVVLIAYLLCGAAIYLVVRAMGEMSVDDPNSGAFSHYAYQNWSQRAGFVSGWNYWFNYIAVAMAELSVVGLYINYWLPQVPHWASAAFFIVAITTANLIGVRAYGEFEFWFAIIKVIAVVGMIVLGLIVIIFGITNNPELSPPSFSNLIADGGFAPFGLVGLIAALPPVMFSFGGLELIGITAGEAVDPKRSLPKAINGVIWRILIFYIGAITIIMAVIPWRTIDGKMSPFVQIFDNVGIGGAAHILNFVVITAVLSVYNSGLYSNGRMLYSLASQGNAPKYLTKLSRNGVPWAGVLTSSLITVIAVVVVFQWPEFAFKYMMSVAVIAGIINWSMIMITQAKFRKRIGPEAASKLTFKLPGGLFTTFGVLAFLGLIVVLMAMSEGYRMAVIVGPVWLLILLVSYEIKTRRKLKN